jgi:predicted lysophospholipase L1 biosynthesis ABC-type transport system permease subunit
VVVLSEPLAQRLFPGAEPLGQRLTLALEGETGQVLTIVGVTADVVTSQMGTERPQLFVPLAQHPTPRVILIARSSVADAPVTSMASAFKTALADVDPEFNPAGLTTGDRLMRRSMNDLTIHSITAVVCANVALTLAALGVYGVVGLMVATRTREIGVRMALGASRSHVLGTVLRDAVKVVVPGIVGGLGLAILLVRVANAPETWYDLGGVEPLAYSLAAAIAMVVAIVAGLPSARRAAAVDPIRAIRSE